MGKYLLYREAVSKTASVEPVSRKRRPRKRRPQTSKTQTSKRKRKDELRDLNSLRSRAKAVFVFVPRLCFLGLCLQGLENADLATKELENTDVSKTLRKITAFARERIMAAMNLNPLIRFFFFFCYLLFCFQFFQI